jgi:predicted dehydrogenase
MRIGIIGAGKIGKLRIESIKRHPTARLAAAFDVSRQAAESAVKGTAATPCTDLTTFLTCGLDAVVVSTPPHLHEEACVAAFDSGLHILCEKPLANSVEGAKRIVEAAKRANRILAVGFNLRYYPIIKFARAAVDNGEIGKVTHIRVFGGHNGLGNFAQDWEYKMPKSGGGAMMDIGVHMTDLARYFLGEITTVYGCMSESVWHVDGSEDNAIAIFKNPEGIVASYQTTWSEWTGYKSCVEIYGDNGMVRAAYAPMQSLLVTNTTKGKLRKVRKFYFGIMLREKLRSWQTTALLSFEEELGDFLKMIDGDYSVALADGHAGLRTIEVSEAVRACSYDGNPVQLPYIGNMRV